MASIPWPRASTRSLALAASTSPSGGHFEYEPAAVRRDAIGRQSPERRDGRLLTLFKSLHLRTPGRNPVARANHAHDRRVAVPSVSDLIRRRKELVVPEVRRTLQASGIFKFVARTGV